MNDSGTFDVAAARQTLLLRVERLTVQLPAELQAFLAFLKALNQA